MTFVHTRLALDRLPSGANLVITLNSGEPHRNVTASIRALGHTIMEDTPLTPTRHRLTVRKA